jgi:putative transposase
MGRPPRAATGGVVYHVLNRANARARIFDDDADYAAFLRIAAEAVERISMRLLAYCLMPNHWHLVLYPRNDGDLSRFTGWLTLTHTQRWHAHRHTAGHGHVYQGRFKSFPVQKDRHFLTLCRYVERNALRAGLVERAERWQWSSLSARRSRREGPDWPKLTDWPIDPPANWLQLVNRPQTAAEETAVQTSIARGRPLGDPRWQKRTAARLDLQTTLRTRGRPRKAKNNGS